MVDPPVPGGDVILTLDRDLQEIGHEALADAIEETGPRAGTSSFPIPRPVRSSLWFPFRTGKPGNLSAINSPYEPGSTLKPFTVAGILLHSVASLADSVDGEEGYGWPGAPSRRPCPTE